MRKLKMELGKPLPVFSVGYSTLPFTLFSFLSLCRKIMVRNSINSGETVVGNVTERV